MSKYVKDRLKLIGVFLVIETIAIALLANDLHDVVVSAGGVAVLALLLAGWLFWRPSQQKPGGLFSRLNRRMWLQKAKRNWPKIVFITIALIFAIAIAFAPLSWQGKVGAAGLFLVFGWLVWGLFVSPPKNGGGPKNGMKVEVISTLVLFAAASGIDWVALAVTLILLALVIAAILDWYTKKNGGPPKE